MSRPRHSIVFVPGLLGTELHYLGDGARNRPRPVWSGDPSVLFDCLAKNADVLKLPLVPGRVILSIEGFGRPLYGPLFDFLVNQLGYVEGENFWKFPYDWRQDNRSTAAALKVFLESSVLSGGQDCVVISHSMGGIVTRLLLADPGNHHIVRRVRQVGRRYGDSGQCTVRNRKGKMASY